MSRKTLPKTSVSVTEEELQLRRQDRGRLLFTTYKERRCALYIQDNRLMAASFFPERPSRIGAVYIGKIKNMVKNINACFVEITGGEICFLSLKDAVVYLLNRNCDGRLIEGDELLVQVTKDSHKTKKASVTTQVSLHNDYFVLSLGSRKIGFSSKLSSDKKKELRAFLTEKGILENGALVQDINRFMSITERGTYGLDFLPEAGTERPPIGCVVRTMAGEEECGGKLLTHLFTLMAQFFRLLHTARYRSCFSCLKEAPEEFDAVFQQFPLKLNGSSSAAAAVSSETESGAGAGLSAGAESDSCSKTEPMNLGWEIVTDQPAMQEPLEKYCREHGINTTVRLYHDEMLSLSILYSIESKLETALSSRVWLKSGGYLIIEPTEAMTVIDVNTGKYEAGKNPQETYLKINLEAAEEIAIQLLLRNLSGIIVVDFINMQSDADNSKLLSHLRSLVQKDKVRTHVVDMTPLGLVEITRKKINKPLREQFRIEQNESKNSK